ncbi:pitrilysin family protein [Thalassobaculum sp. OXR-137]|uniref:M16 family metallopeptidase n=1 Tax=Thalassobaculum sp. OXR-137 TaxID=3100173 RepID=UPI002AC8E072|nr:pitrilysin family protein [Thalassobaculum sp. OXR-137]WPZ35662.1 pitrilysin family protein [Thalassobaculum sp. OXR-137]
MKSLLRLVFCVLVLAPGSALALEIQPVTSPGGIKAWLVEDHRNPILSLNFSFRGGESADPKGKEGRARLVSGLLDEGAGDLDSEAFQKALADSSISIRFNSRSDRFSGSLVTLTETRDKAADLLRLALTEPRFDAEPVERIRAQVSASLRRSLQDPQTIASRTWWATSFPDHPYGRSGDGTLESVAAVTVEDLRAFTDAVLAREDLVIGAVGDIGAEDLSKLLDTVFGGLPETSKAPVVEDTVPVHDGETIVVDLKIPQSVVVFGQSGIDREDPDWFTANLLNRMMAGGFGSRLMEEIREKRGLVYGVWAYLLPLEHSPMVMGGLASQNARVAEAVSLVREEWARMAEHGPTQEELDDARTYLLGSFPLSLTDSDGIASILVSLQENERPIDYLDRLEEVYGGITLADARRVAAKLYRATELTVVVAGQPEGIAPAAPASGG